MLLSTLLIPVKDLHIMVRHAIGLQLIATPPFFMPFMINSILPFVTHGGSIPVLKKVCECFVTRSCKFVNFFNQNPCTPSGPGALQFDIPETRFGILSTVILIFPCFWKLVNLFLTLHNHLPSWLWADFTSQISLQSF